MKRKWIVYENATGQIVGTKQGSSVIPPRAAPGQSVMEVRDFSISADGHFVQNGEATARPEMPMTVREVDGDLEIDAPEGAEIAFHGERFRADRGTDRRPLKTQERQVLFARQFPYKDVKRVFGSPPSRAEREADLAKIDDPQVRDFLSKHVR